LYLLLQGPSGKNIWKATGGAGDRRKIFNFQIDDTGLHDDGWIPSEQIAPNPAVTLARLSPRVNGALLSKSNLIRNSHW
jgi:hypothetical protein